MPSVPSAGSLPGLAAPGGALPTSTGMAGFGGGGAGSWVENTLDEPVWETLKRDVLTIGRNLRSVLIPINWDFSNTSAALNNWDLWGPLVSSSPGQRAPRLARLVRLSAVYMCSEQRAGAGLPVRR